MSSRKIKIITLVSFLAIVFTLFLGLRTTVLAACVGDPDDDCHDCMSPVACNSSKARCTWYDAQAACFEGLEVDWPPAPGGIDLTGESTLLEFIDYIFRWGVLLGGLAAFAILILAGFQYLTSVGDPVKMRGAKDRIRDAILGLVLLLSTFLILNTLNPELTTLVMPSTDPRGFNPGTFSNIDHEKPCKEAIFYRDTDWDNPMAAYFKDPSDWTDWINKIGSLDCDDPVALCQNFECWGCAPPLTPPCPDPGNNCVIRMEEGKCETIGDEGWLGLLGTDDIPMESIKINGACVLTAYTDNKCKDNPSNMSASDPDVRAIFSGYKHSIMMTDRTPPSPPEVENDPAQPLSTRFDSSGITCQVELNGNLLDTGDNDYVKVSLRIGETIDKMLDFPPEETEEWDPPYPFPHPPIPDYWWKKEAQTFEDPDSFKYIVTGLKGPLVFNMATEGRIYYWTAKACGAQGNCIIADEDPDDLDPAEPIEDYPMFELKLFFNPGAVPFVPPQCVATNIPLP